MFLVTGSSGFIGGALKRSWSDASIGLHRGAVVGKNNEISCDLTDRESVKAAAKKLKNISFSHLIHTAGVTPWSDRPDYSLDITMAESVIWLCRELNIPSLYFVSGWNVYDPAAAVPYLESAPLSQIDDYGRSKYEVEKVLSELSADKASVLNLRLASVYGPGQLSNGLIPNLVTAALYKDEIMVKGAHIKRDYVYIDDVTQAIRYLTQEGSISGSINIGSGKSVEVMEVAKTIQSIAKDRYKKDITISATDSTNTNLVDNRLNITKARSMNILQNPTQLAVGIESYMKWRIKEL